ncbi:MAG: hypothetical protein FJ271_12305 [Planctomycetes bacterium]|nr:hypothetical protein [Planctomycetota bacterium]
MTAELARLVLLANVVSTLVLVGVIWFVQIVHYPQFARVGRDGFAGYEAAHVRLTTWVVAPPMLIEALTSGVLAWQPPSPGLTLVCRGGLLLVIVIWLSTAILQVPQHNVLARSFDADAHRRLVASNWIRTICWSLRGLLVVFLLAQLCLGVVQHGQ